MGFSRQEYWSGLLFPSPGDLPDTGIKPTSPALAGGFFTTEPPGKSGNDNGDSHYGLGFPGGSVIKNPPANAGDVGSIPGLGRSPGEGNGNPLQHYCPEKSHGQRSLVGYSLWGRKEPDTTE